MRCANCAVSGPFWATQQPLDCPASHAQLFGDRARRISSSVQLRDLAPIEDPLRPADLGPAARGRSHPSFHSLALHLRAELQQRADYWHQSVRVDALADSDPPDAVLAQLVDTC